MAALVVAGANEAGADILRERMMNAMEASGMKNRIILGIVALIFLALLKAPSGICEETTSALVDTTRTREIRANEPKTPEDLLRVLKSFMKKNPQMSGFDIGEKLSGIARENWGEPYGGLLRGTLEYAPYYRGGKNKPPPGKKANPSQVVKSTTPYHLSSEDGTIELEGQDRLRSIRIGGFKETFCLTPALAREILGEPSSISLGSKGSLLLKYNIAAEQKGYTISIYCTTKQVTKSLDRPAGTFTDKDEFPKIFEERKNTCADGISIYSNK